MSTVGRVSNRGRFAVRNDRYVSSRRNGIERSVRNAGRRQSHPLSALASTPTVLPPLIAGRQVPECQNGGADVTARYAQVFAFAPEGTDVPLAGPTANGRSRSRLGTFTEREPRRVGERLNRWHSSLLRRNATPRALARRSNCPEVAGGLPGPSTRSLVLDSNDVDRFGRRDVVHTFLAHRDLDVSVGREKFDSGASSRTRTAADTGHL